MYQFLLKIWNTILEMWQLSKESRLVAEITIFLLIVLWSLHLSDSILKLPTILLRISNMTAVLTPWLILIAVVLMYNFANRAKNSLLNLQPWKLHEKITLSIGDKYDVFNKDGKKILRITLKNISEQEMPVPYDIPVNHRPKTYNTETATLCVDPSFFVYHGSYTKRILTDPLTDDGLFALTKHSNVEVNHSIFFFNVAYTTENEQLFRCLVDHINPAKKEVELDIYFLQLEKQGSTGTKPLYLTIS